MNWSAFTRPLLTVFVLIAFMLIWPAIGGPLLGAIADSTPEQLSATIYGLAVIGFAFTFVIQIFIAATSRPSRPVAYADPYTIGPKLLSTSEGRLARDAALALHGPAASANELSTTASSISQAWTARSRLKFEESCRHEAAHAVVAHSFGVIVLEAHVAKDADGHVRWVLPAAQLPTADELWIRLCAALAGSLLDHSEGRHNVGSGFDTEQVLRTTIALIGSGQAPDGFAGALTIENILTQARCAVHRILTEEATALTQVAGQLEKSGTLTGYEIRTILTANAAPQQTCEVAANDH